MSGDQEKDRISDEITRVDPAAPILPIVNPATEKPEPPKAGLHPSLYVITWIGLSSGLIFFNKKILSEMKFAFPIILTTWHLSFATLMTQVLTRTTTLLDGRKTVKMTGKVYVRAILPIGLFFSLSLMCGNITYLYLNVSFIQMLKATMPVAVLLVSWAMRVKEPDMMLLYNVSFIVIGVTIATFGEIQFVLTGFLFQLGGIVFEATRLVMVDRLLNSAEFKMDPLVSLYYFAPVCAIMNGLVALVFEVPHLHLADIYRVGMLTLLANASVAFLLNVSVVFLIGKTSSLVLTLCGIIKDVLIILADVFIWGAPVTRLQTFGYTIAVCGLVYYKLGAEKLKAYLAEGNRQWAEYGVRHPALRKIIIFVAVILTLMLVMVGLAPRVGVDSKTVTNTSNKVVSTFIGDKSTGEKATGGWWGH